VLNLVEATGLVTEVRVAPAKTAIVSWNAREPVDTLELVVDRLDGRRSRALPYVVFEDGARASLNGFDDIATIETDVVKAKDEIVAVHVISHHPLERVAASTPPAEAARATEMPMHGAVRELDVPHLSQYLPAFPDRRGWCAPAAMAMLLNARGITATVKDTVDGVFDRSYGGTGNWTFLTAYAAQRGLVAAPAYLRDLVTIEQFIAAFLPLAVSISWSTGELPGAPLEQSAGHILVVRGFTPDGDVIVNDPAQPAIRHIYPRAAFARG
jgi:hypothetical protein